VHSLPIPWSASRVSRGKHWNPRGKDKLWTQWTIKSQYKGKPLDGYIVLDMTFWEPPPLSASKSARARMLSGEIRPTRCDNTNMQKFIEDCLKNIVFRDDRYVCKNISEKLYGTKGKTVIKVYTLEEYNANRAGQH